MLRFLMPPQVTCERLGLGSLGSVSRTLQVTNTEVSTKEIVSSSEVATEKGDDVEDGGYSTESPKVDFDTHSEILALN